MDIKINETYTFNHKEGNVLEKYDGTQCKVIIKDGMHNDMYIAEMCDGRKIQVYTNELTDVSNSVYYYKAFIYHNNNIDSYIDEKAFSKPEQIEKFLNKYEGYWCRIVDLSTLNTMLEGAFDSSFLDEAYYTK